MRHFYTSYPIKCAIFCFNAPRVHGVSLTYSLPTGTFFFLFSKKKFFLPTPSPPPHTFYRASPSYFFPIFSYFSKIFLFIPIFAPKFLFFPIFSLIWNKTYRYLQVCSYMTISATIEKFRPLRGHQFYTNSVQITAHLDIGLTHLKDREDICTHLYLDL